MSCRCHLTPLSLLAVYDKDDNLIWRFEYADGRMPVSMTDKNGKRYYLHYDQVGSLRAVTDSDGNIVKEIVYDTFGNILSDSNPSFKVPFGFAGGLYDPDTKLTHFGFREYDAFTGKWTAKDPLLFEGGDSNLYGYVLGDPVNLVDPWGLFDNYSSSSTEIRTESGEYKIIPPGGSFNGPIDGFRPPAWNGDWIKVPDPANDQCNVNPDGTPDVPWYVPENRIPIHRAPGRKPSDYNWDRGGWI